MRAKRRRDERGATAVEFALILLPFLLLLFGFVQYGLYFYSAQAGSNAANAAIRQLAVGNCQDLTAMRTKLKTRLGAANAGGLPDVTRTYTNPDGTAATPSTVQIGGVVSMQLSFQTLNMHFPFVPFLKDPKVTRDVEARAEDNVENVPVGCAL